LDFHKLKFKNSLEHNMKTLIRLSIIYLCLTTLLLAQGLPVALPEAVELSSDRLKRLESVMSQYVEKKQIVGAVALVSRRGHDTLRRGAFSS
jgi:hypothetical protein